MSNNATKNLILHLSLIPGVGPVTISKIIRISPVATNIYSWTEKEFIQEGLPLQTATLIVQGLKNIQILDQELDAIERYRISWVTLNEPDYPQLLKNIYCPPPVLYYRGQALSSYSPALAFVGSRKATYYCQETVELVLPPLIEQGFCIVSGGALGADSIAHRQTIKLQGKTVAIIGSGLLKPYPASNRYLFNEIVDQGGALVSPFPLFMQAMAGNFPARNRIISGLSRACIVLQAAAQSGALITARYALEQGREVCAVPGPITEPLSYGCHKLLGQGATLVTSANDILMALGYEIKQQAPKSTLSIAVHDPILQALEQPISVDELANHTGQTILELQERLFELQLNGSVTQNFMGLWHIT
ncbi:MAG TPA: DNA-processing protein DprA [Candidatus Babeliaceae bacterium]|nr:DNA-processing protein DprA [Candidatus Babeliaceae bacterium]